MDYTIAVVVIFAVLAFLLQTMKQERKVLEFVGMAVLIAGFVGYFAYRHHKQVLEAQELAAKQAEFDARISRFAESHNAVRDWRKLLGAGRVYSAALAPLLVRQDGRPIFSYAVVQDVSTREGGFVITFKDESHVDPRLKLRLECTSDQAHLAMSHPPYEAYAVVAQIQSLDLVEQAPKDDDTGDPFF